MTLRTRWTPPALFAVVSLTAFGAGLPARPGGDAGLLAPLLSPQAADALAGSLRGFLVRGLPDPLYEASPGWGHTRQGVKAVHWSGLKPEVVHGPRNQGTWRHIRLAAVNLPDTLVLDLRNIRAAGPGRVTFTLFLSFAARLEYRHQHWEAGVRLFDGSARARFRLKLTLDGEVVAHLEPGALLLPEAVVRARLTHADLRIEDFVLEHVAGLGGDAARRIGELSRHALREFHPSLERNLLARANAAILKAGDTKEIRLGWSRIIQALNRGDPRGKTVPAHAAPAPGPAATRAHNPRNSPRGHLVRRSLRHFLPKMELVACPMSHGHIRLQGESATSPLSRPDP